GGLVLPVHNIDTLYENQYDGARAGLDGRVLYRSARQQPCRGILGQPRPQNQSALPLVPRTAASAQCPGLRAARPAPRDATSRRRDADTTIFSRATKGGDLSEQRTR